MISDQNNFSYFNLQVTPMLPAKFQVNWPFVEEKKQIIEFLNGCHDGHLGFRFGTILAIFYLQVTPMLPTKKEKSQGSATIPKRSPSQTPRGRGNRQTQTSTNRTNARKALRLALSSPSEVIAILKGLKTQEQNDTRKDTQQIAPQNKPQSNKEQDQHRDHRPRTAGRANHRGVLKHFYS